MKIVEPDDEICEIKVRLKRKKLNELNTKAKMCGLSREAYIRFRIDGYEPQPLPPKVFFDVYPLYYQIGNLLNQIAVKAHVLNVMDAHRYDECFEWHKQITLHIYEAVMLPRKEVE